MPGEMRPGSVYCLRRNGSEVFEPGFFQDNCCFANDKRTIIGHVDVTGRYLARTSTELGLGSGHELVGRIVGLELHCVDGRYFDLVEVSPSQLDTYPT